MIFSWVKSKHQEGEKVGFYFRQASRIGAWSSEEEGTNGPHAKFVTYDARTARGFIRRALSKLGVVDLRIYSSFIYISALLQLFLQHVFQHVFCTAAFLNVLFSMSFGVFFQYIFRRSFLSMFLGVFTCMFFVHRVLKIVLPCISACYTPWLSACFSACFSGMLCA